MLLLQERTPRSSINWGNDPAIVDVRSPQDTPQTAMRVFARADTSRPAVQLLTNGRYHLMVSNAGGGYSRWHDIAVTRWREDATRDPWGVFCYVRDGDTGKLWSTTPAPTPTAVDYSETIFSESQVEFRRRLDDIEAYSQIVVSPEDDIELRRIRITNRGRVERKIDLMSYAEVVLTSGVGDSLHPAFGNLFVQTEVLADRDAILATRRRRSSEDPQRWMMHLFALHDASSTQTSFETDRLRFIGRGNDAACPTAAISPEPLSGSQGSVLDPVVAIRHRIVLGPDQSAVADLVLGVAESREQCVALVEKYRDRHLADRALEIAWTHNRIALGQINISEVDAQAYSRVASAILYADPAQRVVASTIASNHLAQPGLWAHAISGDLPIVLLKMSGPENLNLTRQLVNAHVYCRMKGLDFDLVIWNEERGGYRQALHDEIMAIVGTSADAAMLEHPGGVFVRSIEQINHEDRVLIQSVARAVFSDQEGSLTEQLDAQKAIGSEIVVPELAPSRAADPPERASPPFPLPARTLVNGVGGFASNGREYAMSIGRNEKTPLPWVNVIANPHFGCVVSESGSGYTWGDNAHEYRLTPWSNDPVCDPAGEVIYIRDEETGEFWSATPAPAPGRGRYVVRHGFGYSIFEHIGRGITSHLRLHVDAEAAVKFFMLRLTNDSGRARKLSVTGYIEWVLGDLREKTAMHVVTELDASGALFARNAYSIEFPGFGGFFRRRQFDAHAERRPHRVHRPQRLAAQTRRNVAPVIERPPRRCHGSVRRYPDSGRACRWRIARFHFPPRRRSQSPGCLAHRRAFPPGRIRSGIVRGDPVALEAAARRDQRVVTRSDLRRHCERLAAVPSRQLPFVGAQRVLPVRRRVRLSRSAAGRDGARPRGCVVAARADRAERVAAIRRGRCSALVASAGGTWRAHAVLGRFPVAPVGDVALRLFDRRRRRARRADRLSRGPSAQPRRGVLLRHAHALGAGRRSLRTLPSRDRTWIPHGRAWIAPDGQRRLERRHEQRRAPRPRRKHLARILLFRRAFGVRADRTAAWRRCVRQPMPQSRQCIEGRAREGRLGRQVVSARVLRRRHTAWLIAQQRMPYRRDCAELGETLRRRRSGPRREARSTRSIVSSSTKTAG